MATPFQYGEGKSNSNPEQRNIPNRRALAKDQSLPAASQIVVDFEQEPAEDAEDLGFMLLSVFLSCCGLGSGPQTQGPMRPMDTFSASSAPSCSISPVRLLLAASQIVVDFEQEHAEDAEDLGFMFLSVFLSCCGLGFGLQTQGPMRPLATFSASSAPSCSISSVRLLLAASQIIVDFEQEHAEDAEDLGTMLLSVFLSCCDLGFGLQTQG
ncbi:MAG: hypothetical protein ACKV0T_20295, partial [Planctomycetales bacterium]